MGQWIDFKELRSRLDFAEVLRHYGVELNVKGDQHHGFCPLPLHEGKAKSRSFSANLKKGIWQCFGCNQKGNLLDFAVLMEQADLKNGNEVRGVAFDLWEKFVDAMAVAKKPKERAKETDDEVVVNEPLDFALKGLDPNHPYLRSRGFTAETIARFGLGYCSRGLLTRRIAIPLHNREGKLIGYAGRVVDDESITEENPKYKLPGKRRRKGVIHEFRKSLVLYNAHRIYAPAESVVVVEGFASVWWLSQAGIHNAVATMGAACSEEQANTIVSLVHEAGTVWTFTDGDSAGERCGESILMQVAPHRLTRWVKMEAGKQPTGYLPIELRAQFPFCIPNEEQATQ
jgi:DNA primase